MRHSIRWLLLVGALAACGKSAEQRGREAAEKETPSAPEKGPPKAASEQGAAPRPVAEAVVGSDPTKLAFERRPLIGMAAAEVKALYGSAVEWESEHGATIKIPQALALDLPPDASEGARDIHIEYHLDDGKVLFYKVSFHRTAEAELVAALTKVRGAPTGTIDVDGLSWASTPPVKLRKTQPAGMTPYLTLSVNVPPGLD